MNDQHAIAIMVAILLNSGVRKEDDKQILECTELANRIFLKAGAFARAGGV